MLNLTPDHLDRHGTMDNYAGIKERLVAASGVAIVGTDDDYSASIASFLQAKGKNVVRIASSSKLADGIWLDGRRLVSSKGRVVATVADLSSAPALRGDHNGQNAAAAFAACQAAGLSQKEIQAGFDSFPGLAHRMEQVAKIGNVLFVNDSKATNADASAKALASYSHIYWIAGGLAKEGGIHPLAGFFPRIAKAYLIGEAAPQFGATLGEKVPFVISQTLDAAVRQAAADAARDKADESVVLLSPACASFDQYQNFEKRGDAFRTCVLALSGAGGGQEAQR
jgi:UDP-N-acetylmuramoylalanine--D-glutamate ligase